MKKTKIKERFENAVDAFFDNEKLSENNALTLADNANLFHENTSESFTGKADNFVKILKQVFLFFPGIFFLYFATFATLNLYFRHDALNEFNILSILLGITATLFGIGNWKNPKHFIMPLSVIGLIFSIYSAAVLLFGISDQDLPNLIVYVFPCALIIPFLAKGLIDKTEKEKSDV